MRLSDLARRSILLVVVLVCWLGLGAAPAWAAEPTQVSSSISIDTTWSAGSTHQITGTVTVDKAARLAIEPGVTVMGDPGSALIVDGQLRAIGTSGSPVTFRGVNLRGRGHYVYPSPVDTFTIDIEHADIDGGSLQGNGESMYGIWTLSDSFVTNVGGPMYLWFPLADCNIQRNVFIDCAKISAGVYVADVNVNDNLFFRADAKPGSATELSIENWAAYLGHKVSAHGNSFLNPGTPTVGLVEGSFSGSLDATSNWWGVAPSQAAKIADMVLDHVDGDDYPGTIDTSGALATASPDAPTTGQPFATLPLAVSATLTGPTAESASGALVTLKGRSTETTRDVAHRAVVWLEQSIDNGSWTTVSSTETSTDANGDAQFSVRPSRDTSYRLKVHDSAVAATATSDPVPVRVRADVGTPTVPRSVKRNHSFSISGLLTPHKAVGSRTVKVRFYRREHGRWVLRATVLTTNSNWGSASRYKASAKLKLAGKYRVIATYAEPGRVSDGSPATTMQVK